MPHPNAVAMTAIATLQWTCSHTGTLKCAKCASGSHTCLLGKHFGEFSVKTLSVGVS